MKDVVKNGLKYGMKLCATVIDVAGRLFKMPFECVMTLLEDRAEKDVKDVAIFKLAASLIMLSLIVLKWEWFMLLLFIIGLTRCVLEIIAEEVNKIKIKGVVENV